MGQTHHLWLGIAVIATILMGMLVSAARPQTAPATQPAVLPVNVLYVETNPRWEFRFIRDELIKDKTVNIATLLISADVDFEQEGDPKVVDAKGNVTFPGPLQKFPETAEELAKFDVLLIGDVDPTYFTPEQQRLIVDFVGKRGGGIGWIAGSNFTPEKYEGTGLEALFPVTPLEKPAKTPPTTAPADEAFSMKLTDEGKKYPQFRLAENNTPAVLEDFPQMYWYKAVNANPECHVLAVHATQMNGDKPMPLIVMGQYGKGRTYFSAVCDTWRWRKQAGQNVFGTYWAQTCRSLAGR